MVAAREGITAWLESRTDAELERLLARRPDVLARPPASLSELGSRLSDPSSLGVALAGLDAAAVQVAALLAHEGGRARAAELESLLARTAQVPPGHVESALQRLAEVGVAWPLEGGVWAAAGGLSGLVAPVLELGVPFNVVAGGASMVGLRAALTLLGLGTAASSWEALRRIEDLLDDPAALAAVLDQAPDGVPELLESLVTEAVRHRPVDAATVWLQERCLLGQGSWGPVLPAALVRHVRLPRVVGRVEVEPVRTPPRGRPADGQDAVMGVVTEVRWLLRRLVERPPKPLADGGVGVQEQRRLAKVMALSQARTRWLLQLCADADLLTCGIAAGGLTTTALAWLSSDDVAAALVLQQAGLLARVVSPEPTGPVLDHVWRGAVRGVRLREIAAAALEPATDATQVAWLCWRTAGLRRDEAERGLELLAQLGLRAGGWPSPWLAPLLDDDLDAASAALDKAMPPEQDELVLQADGTAFVSGRPTEALRGLLDLVGVRESDRTWRITAEGVRDALDAGLTAPALLSELEQRSTHAVPQVLAVLVSDVGARHGRIRVVPSSTLLAVDDPALATELTKDRQLISLGLSVVRPGVLASTKKPAEVMAALRAAGHAPVGPPPAPPKITKTRPQPLSSGYSYGPSAAEVVAALRRAPRAVGSAPVETHGGLQSARWVVAVAQHLPRADLARLVHAVATGLPVEIDYRDTAGTQTTRVVEGLVREGERLRAWCRLRDDERSFYPDQILAARASR